MPRGRPRKSGYNYVPPKRQICDVCGQNLLLDKYYKTNMSQRSIYDFLMSLLTRR